MNMKIPQVLVVLTIQIAIVSCTSNNHTINSENQDSVDISNSALSTSHSTFTQEASANNITMNLINAHTEGSGYLVELCFNLPDQRDWVLTYPNASSATILAAAGLEVKPASEGTMYWKYDQNGKLVQRCQYLYFVVRIPSQTENLSLRIGSLYARGSGQSDHCLEISQKMLENNYDVTIDCMKVNGLEDLVYVKFPVELLSIDPVFKNIFKDVQWDTHAGPRSFTFPVNPR